MIKNEREYRITKARAVEFDETLAALSSNNNSHLHPKVQKAQVDAVRSQRDDLQAEIDDYEALRDGRRKVIELTSLEQLPRALIEGRISAGLTQRDLAERLQVAEQQVQRYEATDYSSVSFSRLVEVARAIGLRMREDVFLPKIELTAQLFTRRLGSAGVSSDFVRRLLLADDASQNDDARVVLHAAGAAQRIFGWTPADIFASSQSLPPSGAAHAALFKIYATADEQKTLFLAAFGRYIAELVVRATPRLATQTIPTDAKAFRDVVMARHGSIDLKSCLEVLWDLGVPVVPLSESGGYHGACWRIAGRNVIVLKQRTHSEARWLHDLLHETYHAGADPERSDLAWLDDDSMPVERRLAPEERKATKFAGDVQLDGRAEELARECVTKAAKKVERLKEIVPKVAKKRGVSQSALANYLAWRLTADKVNWWGTANNLQDTSSVAPWRVTRDFLLPRIEWSQLDRLDRELLTRALKEAA